MTPIKKTKSISPRAFTLIELIVVVTILAILGAIGFVTMTGYFAGARDSARLSDMNSIYTQLNLTAGMDGNLPYPDNYRALSMSGTAPSNIIIYQGYAAKNVLTTIKFEKGGRDPKDDAYYTYTTDKKRKQAQLMGYFEEYDTSKLSNITKLVPEANAATVTDYSDRTVGTIGKKIGTLLELTTFIPVQQTSTGTLDIAAATSTGYIAYFDSTTSGSGAGTDLKAIYVSKSVIYNTGTTASVSTSCGSDHMTTGVNCNTPTNLCISGTPSSVNYNWENNKFEWTCTDNGKTESCWQNAKNNFSPDCTT